MEKNLVCLLMKAYKLRLLTQSELFSEALSCNIKLTKEILNMFTVFTYKNIKLYSISNTTTSLLDIAPLNITYIEEDVKEYTPSQEDMRLLMLISLSGAARKRNSNLFPRGSSVERLLLSGILEAVTRDKEIFYVISRRGQNLLKKRNMNYHRKNVNSGFSDYLLHNFANMDTKVIKTYTLPKYTKGITKSLESFYSGGSYIIFDVESICYTKGAYPKVIEIGAIKVINGIVTEKFSEIIKQSIPVVPKNITNLTGITIDMVRNGNPPASSLKRFIDFCEDYPLVAHGIENDWHISLLHEFYLHKIKIPKNALLDSFTFINTLNPSEKNGLTSLIERYELNSHGISQHRAYNDSLLTHMAIRASILEMETKKNC